VKVDNIYKRSKLIEKYNKLLILYTLNSLILITFSSISITILFCVFPQAIAQIANPHQGNSTIASNFLTYVNSTYGIKIKYSSEWTKLDQGLDIFGNNKTVVMFFAPSKDVNLAIIIDKIAPNTTLNQYTKENININNNTLPLGVLKNTIIQSNAATLDGNEAHEIISNLQYAGIPSVLKVMNIWTLHDDKAYGIGYSGPEDNYYKYWTIAQEMINSFQIIK
jgi:hypothetical protein